MRISKIEIRNFRLLQNVRLSLEDDVTVIVGRNNSGKTSLTELFKRLLGDKTPSFHLEDFSCATHESFHSAYKRKLSGTEANEIREALPMIEVRIWISYDASGSDLGTLSQFVVDLDPGCTNALIAIRYELEDGKIESLFAECSAAEADKDKFYKLMKERVPKLYKTTIQAIDPSDATNQKKLEWTALSSLLQSGFINAQRWLDDTTHRDNDVLGKVLESLFKTAHSELADDKDKKVVESLDTAVEGVRTQLDSELNKNLKELLPALSLFGYPGLTDPELRTETTLDVQRLLVNHTKVRYAGSSSVSLPEAYNGLGPRNLIYILLQLLEFFKSYKAKAEAPGIQIIFIEEPEAHLHPQMAEVFIRKLKDISKIFSTMYNENVPWPVQFIVSTHSSHLANAAHFETIRYFLATPEARGHHLRQTIIKDLRDGLSATPKDIRDFLHQYLTLTRCDLFFADKAVLIEGSSERILLPKMIEKIDIEFPEACLSSQYVSVVEVYGAYAHRFFQLLNFLELRTLIITDLDAAKQNNESRLEKCLVADSTATTNGCLKDWFNNASISPSELISKSSMEKTHGAIHLAYQVPEISGGPCGRTFEDAFILANTNLFDMESTSPEQKAKIASEKASESNKSEFALVYALEKTAWKVPRYISDGLQWLAKNPSDISGATSISDASTDQVPSNLATASLTTASQ